MLNIKLTSSTPDFSFDYFIAAHIYGEDNNYLRTYEDFKRRDVTGWFLIDVQAHHIWVSNESHEADETVFVCVCLDCGHKTIQLYNHCEKCGSIREPTYLEI